MELDSLPRTESQSSLSSIFSDATSSTIDDDLVLSDASESDEDDGDQTAIREASILDSDKTVEDIDVSEEMVSGEDDMANDADDEQTVEGVEATVTKGLVQSDAQLLTFTPIT